MKKENRGGPREGAGRPRFEPDEQKRRNISLSDRYMEMARKLGNGNATAGIRKALETDAPTVEQLRELIVSWRETGRSLNQNETKIALGTGLFHCAEELEKLIH